MIRTLELQDLSCGACAETIRTGLALAGFTSVKVTLLTHPHTATAEIIDDEHLELFKSVLRGHGYHLIDDELQDRLLELVFFLTLYLILVNI